MYKAFACKKTITYMAYYNYRVNFTGISKGGIKRPLDKSLAFKKLITSLKELHKDTKIIEQQLACEIYQYIRRINFVYSFTEFKRELYDYLMANLVIRRKFFAYIMLKNRNIRAI